MVLRTRTTAASALRSLVAERLGGVETHGILIAGLVLVGIERTDHLIIQGTLVGVHVFGVIRIVAVQILGELQEIVSAAGLVDVGVGLRLTLLHTIGRHAQYLGIGLTEHFTVAHTTRGIHIATLDQVPEVLREIVVERILVGLVTAQRADNHRDMLVGMAGTDVVHVDRQWLVELGSIETVACLDELRLVILVRYHLGEASQRLTDASHLSGDVHVPHLIAVARLAATLVLCAVLLHISAVVHTVPHPESHVLGYLESLVANLLVVEVGSDVDETRQLLVNTIIRCPNPVGVVVGTIHLDKGAVLGRDGVEIAVAILLGVLLVFVESLPGTLHLTKFCLRGEITCLPVALQVLVIYEGTLLALTEFVHHTGDVFAKDCLLLGIGSHGISLCDGRHIVARAMSLELGVGRVPTVRFCVALRGKTVGVAVVIELLGNVPGTNLTDCLVAVVGEAVVTVHGHVGEREGVRHLLLGNLIALSHHLHLCLDGITVIGRLVTDDETTHLILGAYAVLLNVSLRLLIGERTVGPAHLAIFGVTVRVGYPNKIRKTRGSALWTIHRYRRHLGDGAVNSGCMCHSWQACYTY